MNDRLTLLNIAPLLPGYEDLLAEDIRRMYQTGVITETAFIMSLVPEGDPPVDKAKLLGDLFEKHRAAIGKTNMPVGILLQSTVGHGWVPPARSPFQKQVRGNGENTYKFCPMDKDFEAYIFDTVSRLAKRKPDFFMLDDDTRFLTCLNGCFCPLHIAEFNREQGTAYDESGLRLAVDQDRQIAAAYDDLLKRTMVRHARNIRNAIDSVDPALHCQFCICVQDVRHAPEMAETLAAPGNPVTIRLNNGLYLQDTPREIPSWLWRTDWQLRVLGPEVRVLGEPDTCPQNNYSTSAAILHCHMTHSILSGCKGGKLWLTRTSVPEMASGVRYRKILSHNRNFYETIAATAPAWHGVTAPVPSPDFLNFPLWDLKEPEKNIPVHLVEGGNWSSLVLGKMGFPVCNKGVWELLEGDTVALAGADCAFLSDEELKTLFRKCHVLLDGAAAEDVVRRGFGEETGLLAVEEISGKSVALETFPDGKLIAGQTRMRKITASPACEVLSELWHKESRYAEEKCFIAPGAVKFVNPAGRTVISMACMVQILGHGAFGMMNETRKAVLKTWLDMLSPLPWYVPGDDEVLFRYGRSGEYDILAVTDISLDDMPEIPLAGSAAKKALCVEMLLADGRWEECPFDRTAAGIVIRHTCRTLRPAVFRVRREDGV